NGQPIDDIGRDELVAAVARAALLGARGNSGVILSQIVRGAAEELASRPGELVDPILVSAALARAADAAYTSVRDPAEGTVLMAGLIGALRDDRPPALEHHTAPAGALHHAHGHESSRFRYCTNFAVTGDGLEAGRFIAQLEEIGDSVLVVGDRKTLKVHVHT